MDDLENRLPVKLDSATNGEFIPRPLPDIVKAGNSKALEQGAKNAKALNISRRAFFVSTAGTAATLLAFNEAQALVGATGGFYDLPPEAAFETRAAEAALGNGEFVFDIQGHHVSPIAKWRDRSSPFIEWLRHTPILQDIPTSELGEYGHLDRLGRDVFIREIFMDSDTDMAVLTFVPTSEKQMPLSTEEADVTRAVAKALDGTDRLLIHGRVIPNLTGDIDRMPELLHTWNISAWKTYTQFEEGWWLDDERSGVPFIEAARHLDKRLICIHKGVPLGPMNAENARFGRCDDVGRVAARYPDVSFIIYHSGFHPDIREEKFVPGSGRGGVDSLVQSLLDNGIKPNSNVYAELGTTWREVMKDHDQAAHLLGKLVRHVGENNVVWGTDSIWYGSPQDQIQAFRAFQISDQFCEQFGYTKLTRDVKAKILGLNGARIYGVNPKKFKRAAENDSISRQRAEYRENPSPSFLTYGPRTRAEFLRMHKPA